MVERFEELTQDEMLGDVQKNISNIAMPKQMEEEYDAMVSAEDQEERESVETDTDDEPFDFKKRTEYIQKKLDAPGGATFSPPTPVSTLSTVEAKQEALAQSLAKADDIFIDTARSLDEPFKNVGRRLVEGTSKGMFLDAPKLIADATEIIPRYSYILSRKVTDWVFEDVVNPVVSLFERADKSTTGYDVAKLEHGDPIDTTEVDRMTDPYAKTIRKWANTTGREINDIIIDYVGVVPEVHRNLFTDIAFRTGELGAPIVPLLSGLLMVLRYPKLYNSVKDTSSSMIKNHMKATYQTGKEAVERGIGVFNSALGGAIAWQTAEHYYRGTDMEDMAMFMAIPGSIYGANGLARLPFTMSFGIAFAAAAKVGGVKLGEDMSPMMMKAVAMAQGIPMKEIWSSNKEQLMNKLMLTSGPHLKYIDDIANGIRSLPRKYRKALHESFQKTQQLMEKYQGPDGERLAFFLAQVTGLGIQSAMLKAASTPLGMKFRPRMAGMLSDLEVQQEVVNNQMGIIKESMRKILNQEDLAEPPNEEFLKIIRVLEKQLDGQAAQGQDTLLKIQDIANEAHIFANAEKKGIVDRVASEVFGVDKLVAGRVTARQIEDRRIQLNTRADELLRNSFETAKKQNDDLYDALKGEDRLVDATSLVLMAKDVKMLGALSTLKTKGTKAGRRINAQADLIFNARMNTLELLSGKQLEELYGRIQRLSISDDIVFTTNKGAEFNFKTIGEDLKNTLNPDARDAKIREYLADINTNDLDAFDAINKEIPPRYLLTDLLAYRSELYSSFTSKRGSAEGHAIEQLIDAVDDTLDGHFGDVADGDAVKKMYENAKEFYKARILPYKTHLGKRMHDTAHSTDNFADEQSIENLFAMFTRFKDPEQMGKVFKGMFDEGVDTPLIAKFGEGENFQEAAKIFQTTIGRILSNDIPGYKTAFINNMTLEQIAAMQKYKMITKEQFDGLSDIMKIRDEVKEALDTVSQKAQRSTFEKDVIPYLKKSIEKQYGEGSDLAVKVASLTNADDLVDEILRAGNVQTPSLRTTGGVQPTLKRADETLRDIDPDLAVRFESTLRPIPKDLGKNPILDQVLDIINKNELDPKKRIEILENLERMIVYRVYKNSFTLTDARNLAKSVDEISPNNPLRKFTALEDSGLLNNIDLIAMGKTLQDAMPSLGDIGDAIDKTRASMGVLPKIRKRQTTNNLAELFEIARLSLAKVTNIPVGKIGMSMAMSSLISRAYAIARGVVSLRFVATELFLRVHGQNKMKYINEVLTNPESVKVMHDVLVKGKPVSKEHVKYWRYVLGFMFSKEAMNKVQDEDVRKSLEVYLDVNTDRERLPSERPNTVQFRSNRIKVDTSLLRDKDDPDRPNTSFLPSPEAMEKIRKAGKANRPKKFERNIGKAGMPGFTVR